MPHGLRHREEGLKQTLRTNVVGDTNKITIGRGQQINKNLVTPSQLDQPTVRPNRGLKRFVGEIVEGAGIAGRAALNLAVGGEKGKQIGRGIGRAVTGAGRNRSRVVSPAIRPEEIEQGRLIPPPKKAKRSTAFASPISKTGPRQLGTSILTKKGGRDVLRGTRTPGPEIDFTRGKPLKKAGGMKKKDFSFFGAASEIAQELASPEFRKGQRRARGKLAQRKARLAETKTIDASIKSISGALQGIAFTGNTELKNNLSAQLDQLLKQRANVGGPVGAGGLNVGTPGETLNSLAKAGFEQEEALSITRRIHEGTREI